LKILLKYYVISKETSFAPIPAVTEPPKVLGPPTDVFVPRTLDNHVDAHNQLTSSVLYINIIPPKSASPITLTLHHIGKRISGSELQ
jgi:hypothetical protein